MTRPAPPNASAAPLQGEGLEATLLARLRARARDLEALLARRATQRGRFARAGELRRVRDDLDALLDALNELRGAGHGREAPGPPGPDEPRTPLPPGAGSPRDLVPSSR
jgi:hypothetical protein